MVSTGSFTVLDESGASVLPILDPRGMRRSPPRNVYLKTSSGPTETHGPLTEGPRLPTPPMSSPESSSPPPPLLSRGRSTNVSSPDIIPQEVLQGISKIALVKNFNRRHIENEIKERRQSELLAEKTPQNDTKVHTSSPEDEERLILDANKNGRISQLDEVDEYQKRIEQENSQRKLLLAQAVLDRERRTVAEVHRLERIKTELARLDHILSSDVAILRREIEAASVEFNEAEKNYVRIEKEFIEAKFLLHQKLDRKEKLTEHLCFIIEENESRKAKKLQQLMDELNEDATREDYQILPVYDQEELCSSCGGFPESTTDDESTKMKSLPSQLAQ
ncbi:RAB6-interacting golgin [Galendromus occidentalis]|uniref:RAB6-interacting golgin n=1 Tax=Galendromus occidentalis TaxID=34638 RepID=A0AAJ6VV69_9ACAR|nr:RAB6-interacting golgin [Galendromus occidentalis]